MPAQRLWAPARNRSSNQYSGQAREVVLLGLRQVVVGRGRSGAEAMTPSIAKVREALREEAAAHGLWGTNERSVYLSALSASLEGCVIVPVRFVEATEAVRALR